MTGEGMVEICRHYADHLEGIAIAASPQCVDENEDSDADSERSHGHRQGDENALPTIEEYDEEPSEPLPEATGSTPKVIDSTPEATDISSKATALTPEAPAPSDNVYSEAPNCAICNAPSYPECPCESERLQIAVRQAEQYAMDEGLAEIRFVTLIHFMVSLLTTYHQGLGRQPCAPAYTEGIPEP
jgi:hypothetical protein